MHGNRFEAAPPGVRAAAGDRTRALPAPFVNAHKCVPIALINNRLTLAMTDPNNIVAFDDVRRMLKGVVIEPTAIAEDDSKRFMSTTYATRWQNGRAKAGRAAGRRKPRRRQRSTSCNRT